MHNINEVGVSKPQYQTVLKGKEDEHLGESDVDSEYISALSFEEEMKVDGFHQDSDSEDTDAYFTPSSSFNRLTLGRHLSKAFNKEELVLNGIKTEVEERQYLDDKFRHDDEMVEVKECEEESQEVAHEADGKNSEITAKTGRVKCMVFV